MDATQFSTKESAASMRPPHYAGENRAANAIDFARNRCFNEAPALRGGKPGLRCPGGASPRSFNEAPALRGGKRPQRMYPIVLDNMRFNEAPALRGGKPFGCLVCCCP